VLPPAPPELKRSVASFNGEAGDTLMKAAAARSLLLLCLLTFTGADTLAQTRTGQYDRKDKEKYGGYGTLKIREIKRGKRKVMSFDLWIGRTGPTPAYHCTGDVKGIAKWTASNVAEYNADLNERDEDGELVKCHLIFFFTCNAITVREENCGHGAACEFNGTYKRQKSRQ
jgi:hypothetical protein